MKQTREEFLKEVEKTGTTVSFRMISGYKYDVYKEPAVGKCDNCNEVKMWQKQKGLKLADVKCGTCGGELKRTTYTAKLPYKANTPVGVEAKAKEFARKILEE
jgi:Zn finger protein HypA/HybF involved in hydrogenase expression